MRIAIDIDSTLHHYWDVLIDDSAANLTGALESGMTAATLIHPWNEQLCDEENVICARDRPTLRTRLEPILAAA